MKFYISTGVSSWVPNPRVIEYAKDLRNRGHEAVYGGRYSGIDPSRDRYGGDLGRLCASDYLVVTTDPRQAELSADQGVEIGVAVALEIPILAVGPVAGPMFLARTRFHDWIDFLNSPLVKVRHQTPDMAAALLDQIPREG